jgi:hypothetical protein
MYYLGELVEFKEKNKDKPNYARVGVLGAGTVYLGQQTVKSSVPRLLGVRLESHSTSKSRAKEILKSGGWLDPSKGGTGAGKAMGHEGFVERSKKYVHITGTHPDSRLNFLPITKPVANPYYRKLQRGMYRGLVGEEIKNPKEMAVGIAKGFAGIKGRSLYIGGTDDYFRNNFIPDPDDVALKTDKAIKVYGNRFSATKAAIKETGLLKLIKANPKRVLSGAVILGVGSALTARNAKKTIDALNPHKEIVTVKSSIRKGKVVKGYRRKNTKRRK